MAMGGMTAGTSRRGRNLPMSDLTTPRDYRMDSTTQGPGRRGVVFALAGLLLLGLGVLVGQWLAGTL